MYFFRKTAIKVKLHGIFIIACVVSVASLSLIGTSCKSGPKEEIVDVPDIDSLPGMATTGITSLISDSGIIRYRIITEEWLIFDKVKQPYWFFPKGVNVERFDSTLHVDARIKSDTAYFYERRQLWELKGHVHLENLQGEKFDTELLFWDQKQERIYSDKFIHIEQKERIITGFGFDSNQSMTVYTIRRPQGIFPIEGGINMPDSLAAAEKDTIQLNTNAPK
jgi:LPS export ABC transporter protein LptC